MTSIDHPAGRQGRRATVPFAVQPADSAAECGEPQAQGAPAEGCSASAEGATTRVEPHPALCRDNEWALPSLVLLIPSALGEAETLRRLAAAMQEARNTIASRMGVMQQAADEAQQAGDQLRQALLRGQILSLYSVAKYVDEHVMGQFGLFDDAPSSERRLDDDASEDVATWVESADG